VPVPAAEWTTTILVGVGVLGKLAARAARPLSPWLGSGASITPGNGRVVLTFDDGPTAGETDLILRVLGARGATATFFVLVNRARRSPGLLHEVRDAGHEIALHGPDHRPLTSFGAREVGRRTRDARRELEDLAQVPVRWFRPPYGKQHVGAVMAVRRLGLTPVLWESGLYDWVDLPQDTRIERGLSETRPGSVVLMHDGFAGTEDGVDDGPDPGVDRPDLVARTLDALAGRGLAATSLEVALGSAELVLRPRFHG
jgi:peptidoglycan/xylan/chitin deacetylase (PgdA/CDA1 family)